MAIIIALLSTLARLMRPTRGLHNAPWYDRPELPASAAAPVAAVTPTPAAPAAASPRHAVRWRAHAHPPPRIRPYIPAHALPGKARALADTAPPLPLTAGG